jgi:hypothetical protein
MRVLTWVPSEVVLVLFKPAYLFSGSTQRAHFEEDLKWIKPPVRVSLGKSGPISRQRSSEFQTGPNGARF